MSSPERNTASEYERSAEQLFALLAMQDTATSQFYDATWDQADKTRLQHLKTMSATPTGALADKRWGQFYSAQFRLTETTQDGDLPRRYIWCYTGPINAGSPVEPDLLKLEEDHRYIKATPDNVVRTLLGQTDSLDDQLTLMRLMRRHAVKPTTKLTNIVSRLVTDFVVRHIEQPAVLGSEINQGKILEFLDSYLKLELDAAQASKIQRNFAVPLLREIAHSRASRSSVHIEKADNAALLLEAALRQNTLLSRHRVRDRIFGNTTLYKYPFATELLHSELQNTDQEHHSKIFNTKRIEFVGEYITALIHMHHPQFDSAMQKLLTRSGVYNYVRGYPHGLHKLTDGLVQLVNDAMPDPATVPIPIESRLSHVGQGFAYALARINGKHYKKEDDPRLLFDAHSVRNVERVLAPLYRHIGKASLSKDNSGIA